MKHKVWTKEEKEYLSDKWGALSIKTIAKNLGRTENAVIIMVRKLQLGAFLDNGDYITWNQLQRELGSGGYTYKEISWIKNRNFPIHRKRVGTNSFKIVYFDEFWEWAEKNKEILDFSKLEENIFGAEPEWVKEKRKHDFKINRAYKKTPWTKAEDDHLKYLLDQQKYSYHELSQTLHRTAGAIQRRICDLKIMDRPIKADNHIKWTNDEIESMKKMIWNGCGYEFLSQKLNKSSKAIRGKIYRMYGTENLDKVREKKGK